jgi:hypothetical protein
MLSSILDESIFLFSIYSHQRPICSALVFVDKLGGWIDKEAERRYLWEIFARDAVYNTECFCQLTWIIHEESRKSRKESLKRNRIKLSKI